MTDLNTLDPERALLGSVLASAKAFTTVEDIVDPADFADIRYEALWSLISTLAREGRPHDPTHVAAALPTIPEESRRGIGPLEILELYSDAPIGLAHHYAKLVAGNASMRRLEAVGTRLVQMARNGTHDDVEHIVANARTALDNAGKVVSDVNHLSGIMARLLDTMEDPATFIPTPWREVNDYIGGWRPGCLYLLGARPGVGKTIMGIQAGLGVAEKAAVAFSTLEMSDLEVAERVIAQRANVPFSHLKDHRLDETDWKRISNAQAQLAELGFYVDDKAAVSPSQIRAHARAVARRGPLGAIFIDYIQLMTPAPGDKRPRQEVISAFSRELKILAKDLHVPVIAMAQLNRGSEQRADPRPMKSDLRESGSLEQDADVVLLLHSTEEEPHILEVGVAKNRHGQTGHARLEFEGAYQRAVDLRWAPRMPADVEPPQYVH